jgi:hypothetical protein
VCITNIGYMSLSSFLAVFPRYPTNHPALATQRHFLAETIKRQLRNGGEGRAGRAELPPRTAAALRKEMKQGYAESAAARVVALGAGHPLSRVSLDEAELA